MVDYMNEFFHKRVAMPAGCWGRLMHELGVGCSKVLRAIGNRGGIPPELERAIAKRELEKKLRAEGYSLRLAKIAAHEAFKPRRQSN